MSQSQSSFVWYELLTSDAAAAKSFYTAVVGWGIEDVPVLDMTYTLLKAGDVQVGGLIEMTKAAGAGGVKQGWIGYIGVDDVDAMTQSVRQNGGSVRRPPSDIPNTGRFSVVADPQGAPFYLFKPNRPGTPPPSTQPGQIGWRELHTTDWSAAFSFYSGLFGWTKDAALDMGPIGIYQLFVVTGEQSGGMFNSPAAGAGPYWQFYFLTDSVTAGAKRITDAGGRVLNGPMQVPGGQWTVQASDPQGAFFALLSPKE